MARRFTYGYWVLVIQYRPIITTMGSVHVPAPEVLNYTSEAAAHDWARVYCDAGVTASHMILEPAN